MNEFATENLLFVIELIHIKHAFVLRNYGVVKTIKPEKLKQYVYHDKMTNHRFMNGHTQIPELTEISGSEKLDRGQSLSHSDHGPVTLYMEDTNTNPSIMSLPSLQPTLTPVHSAALNHSPHVSNTPNHSNISNHSNTLHHASNSSDTPSKDELEMDPEADYQVIDFNDVSDPAHRRDSVYNSMAQNYLTVHSYLFSESGIAARLELPSGTVVHLLCLCLSYTIIIISDIYTY